MRKLMWFTIGFGGSSALAVYCLQNAWIIPAVMAGIILCALFFFLRVRRAAMVFLGFSIGMCSYFLFLQYYLIPAHAMDGVHVDTEVRITGYSYETTYGVGVDGEFDLGGNTYNIRLYVNDKIQIRPGDTVKGTFRLCYTAPGGMNDPTYHAGERILLLGYSSGGVELIRRTEENIRFFAADIAYHIKEQLRQILPGDVFPFAQALLLGDSTQLSYQEETALRLSGIRHIIAVSGLHVSILYSVISVATFRKRFLTALIGFPVLALFAAIAGFTPSVTRACIMVGLMMLSQMFNREYDPPTALAFAALVMLVMNPLVITSISFQLSVGCVAGILLFQTPILEYLKARLGNPKGKSVSARIKRGFLSSISVSLSAMSLTIPLSAFYFGTVSLVGVVTNLLTLWVVSFVFVCLALLALCSFILPKLAPAFGWLLAWPIRYILSVSGILASFPLSAVYTKSVYVVIWLVFVYILLGIFLISRKRKPLVLLCCGMIGLCGALMASWLEPLSDDVRMTVLDVGQGQSIILQSEGRTYLVDCGGGNPEITADLAADTLLSQGIFRLDGLILTHTDADHAGSAAMLLSRVPADLVLLPVTADPETAEQIRLASQCGTHPVEDTVQISFGDSSIRVFGPIFAADSNENSLCVLFTAESCDILITGDRGSVGERMLLREPDLPQVDVLVVGHHGSRFSTSAELLERVSPEVAVISVGSDNPYGHPSQEVLDRLEQAGCRIYRTDQQGTIIFRR